MLLVTVQVIANETAMANETIITYTVYTVTTVAVEEQVNNKRQTHSIFSQSASTITVATVIIITIAKIIIIITIDS